MFGHKDHKDVDMPFSRKPEFYRYNANVIGTGAEGIPYPVINTAFTAREVQVAGVTDTVRANITSTLTGEQTVYYSISGNNISASDFIDNTLTGSALLSPSGSLTLDKTIKISGIDNTPSKVFTITLRTGDPNIGDIIAQQNAEIIFQGNVNSSGGTTSISNSYVIHTFTANSSFSFSKPATFEFIAVGGGGGGGRGMTGRPSGTAGGGGGGGAMWSDTTVSRINGSYTVLVGTGGGSGTGLGGPGGDGKLSEIFGYQALGGGGGGDAEGLGSSASNGRNGGSGGGAARFGVKGLPINAALGNPGGNVSPRNSGQTGGGGGGGRGGEGQTGTTNSNYGPGQGGIGIQSAITGTLTYYAGGGGGGGASTSAAPPLQTAGASGGLGGGGTGGGTGTGSAGTNGLGGGGGAGYQGGSGVVIVKSAPYSKALSLL